VVHPSKVAVWIRPFVHIEHSPNEISTSFLSSASLRRRCLGIKKGDLSARMGEYRVPDESSLRFWHLLEEMI
jgi:hypothetical protein